MASIFTLSEQTNQTAALILTVSEQTKQRASLILTVSEQTNQTAALILTVEWVDEDLGLDVLDSREAQTLLQPHHYHLLLTGLKRHIV